MWEVASALNELAIDDAYDIAKLHKFRGANWKTIFDKRTCSKEWAFHYGGRTELQFNIGVETLQNGTKIFRYGIAFSLQKGRSQLDPIGSISKRIKAFNDLVSEEDLTGFKMWNGSTPQRAGVIPDEWVEEGNFIFIGKYFNKSANDLSTTDYRKILETFDELLPIYKLVEDNYKAYSSDKTSKICWNSNGWKKPSGIEGKSRDSDSHECEYGYGHEEWLFDFDKLIDGYHYSFLQPIGKHRDLYTGESFDIALYSTKSGRQNHSYWVAEIHHAEVIDKNLELEVIEQYKGYGWLDEMISDLEQVEADSESFSELVSEGSLFNIRFKPEDVQWYGVDQVVPFEPGIQISHARYTLLNGKAGLITPDKIDQDRELTFSGKDEVDLGSGVRQASQQKAMQYSQLHKEIQNGLAEYLRNKYPNATVDLETSKKGCGTSIDLVLEKSPTNRIFYEVKTYQSAKMCIREAVGQLLEYAYYPKENMAKKLVIVSQAPLTVDDETYLEHLRNKFKVPIGYMQFDHKKKEAINSVFRN